jgi:acyl dehydratase
MPVDADLVGKTYPPSPPFTVTPESIAAFDAATGGDGTATRAPATYPIVLAFEAMRAFLDAEGLALQHIVHGEQRFHHERPVVPGDVLTATLELASVRTIAGRDIIGTRSSITDADGALVCTGTATLVHSGDGQ